MDAFDTSGDRTPLGDLTNTTSGCQNSCNTRLQLIDPKQRRRERDRARYAAMTDEKKMEINKKRREARKKKKDGGSSRSDNVSEALEENNNSHQPYQLPGDDGDAILHNEVECPMETTDSYQHQDVDNDSIFQSPNMQTPCCVDSEELHDKFQPQIQDTNQRKRERDRARCAAMSNEKKMEINKKRREARKRKKDGNAALNDENVDLDENNDWLHGNESYQPETRNDDNGNNVVQLPDQNDGISPVPVDNPKMERSSRKKARRRRSNKITPTVKKDRKEQHRLYNKTPGRKVANRECQKRKRELKKNAINQESIAMENPNSLPDSSFNWTIPEVNGTPVYIESTSDQTQSVETPDMLVHKTQRHHVTHGERCSLLARQNKKFESTIARRANGSPDEIHSIAEDGVIDNGSVDPSPLVDIPADTTTKTQPYTIEDDADEDVIFEEEEDEEDEGYLFAGQEIHA